MACGTRPSRWGRAARGAGAGSAEAPRCPICLEPVSDDARLPCGHAACSPCVLEHLRSLIGEGRVQPAELCCCLPECRAPLPEGLVATLLRAAPGGHELHQRLLDLQASRFEPEPGAGEQLLDCPAPGCGRLLVPESLVRARQEVTCPACSQRFCAGCCQPAHGGMSCEAAEAERMDPELQALIARKRLRRCPGCRSLCERESGCNFMTCPSERCQRKTHFCYLCEELLTAADHAAHFEGFEGAVGRMGPFGSVCVNHRLHDASLPSRPPPPRLSVVTGEEQGQIALRITWGPHSSEPPTIYYRVRLSTPGSAEVRHFSLQAGEPHHDLPRRLPRYVRYQAAVVPVNVNGAGPSSEASEVVHFHPRELADAGAHGCEPTSGAAAKTKRWSAR